jgi:nucleoside-diphosphate-sugar epimerase
MSFIENKIVEEDISSIIKSNIEWNKFKNKTIIVTGSNGFFGKYFIATLIKLNDEKKLNISILAIVRSLDKNSWLSKVSKIHKKLELVKSDLGKDEIKINKDINFIFHIASNASPKFYSSDPVGTILPNTIGTNNLLKLLHKSKNPDSFIFISSSEIYGNSDTHEELTELDMGVIDPMSIRSCYAESKRCGENLCVSWSHQYNLSTKVVRPFHTYGPGLKENDGRVFADFAYDINSNRDIIMKSDGTARRCFCYITDAIEGIFKVAINGKSSEAYNLANPNGDMSIHELATMLVDLFPEKNLSVRIQDENLKIINSKFNESKPNIKKISDLGWSPKIAPNEGFYRMIKSLEEPFQ